MNTISARPALALSVMVGRTAPRAPLDDDWKGDIPVALNRYQATRVSPFRFAGSDGEPVEVRALPSPSPRPSPRGEGDRFVAAVDHLESARATLPCVQDRARKLERRASLGTTRPGPEYDRLAPCAGSVNDQPGRAMLGALVRSTAPADPSAWIALLLRSCRSFPPLPQGEGRGEGEGSPPSASGMNGSSATKCAPTFWCAAGSAAPRRIPNATKAVSPLRSATAVHGFAICAHTARSYSPVPGP